ncbi:MAG: hypothetical protein ACE5KE_05755 [Methanosarcinales archaeon]
MSLTATSAYNEFLVSWAWFSYLAPLIIPAKVVMIDFIMRLTLSGWHCAHPLPLARTSIADGFG